MANRLDSIGLSRLWTGFKNLLGSFSISTGTISSLPMTINDSRIDASYVVQNEFIFKDVDIGWVTTTGKVILYGTGNAPLPSGTTKPSVKLHMHKVHGLEADPVEVTLQFQASSSANGNYLVARGKNMIPGTQYTWYLMKVVSGGTDTQAYAIGATPSTPEYTMWFQEVPRSLENGASYYVKLKTTTGSETPAQSSAVEFEGSGGGS